MCCCRTGLGWFGLGRIGPRYQLGYRPDISFQEYMCCSTLFQLRRSFISVKKKFSVTKRQKFRVQKFWVRKEINIAQLRTSNRGR